MSTKKQDMEIHMQKVSELYKNLNTEPVEYDNFEFVPAASYSFQLGHLFTFANPHTSEIINLQSSLDLLVTFLYLLILLAVMLYRSVVLSVHFLSVILHHVVVSLVACDVHSVL